MYTCKKSSVSSLKYFHTKLIIFDPITLADKSLTRIYKYTLQVQKKAKQKIYIYMYLKKSRACKTMQLMHLEAKHARYEIKQQIQHANGLISKNKNLNKVFETVAPGNYQGKIDLYTTSPAYTLLSLFTTVYALKYIAQISIHVYLKMTSCSLYKIRAETSKRSYLTKSNKLFSTYSL